MNSRWSDTDAAECVARYAPAWSEALAYRVYSSRLMGAEPALVLHGGGNTSVKGTWRTALCETVPAIFVKASGFDLAQIGPDAFPPLDLAHLRRLCALDALDDETMVNEIRTHLFNHRSPTPSIETLVHAFLPPPYIDHTHADAILALSNQQGGASLLREALGGEVPVLEYIEPGFRLARAAAAALEASPRATGLVLMRHGLITWGETARAAYETTIELVTRAEQYATSRAKRGRTVFISRDDIATAWDRLAAVGPIVRGQLAHPSGDPDLPWDRVVVLPLVTDEILAFLASDGAKDAAVTPPLTTDHLIRTKSLPLWVDRPEFSDQAAFKTQLGTALKTYTEAYQAYVDRHHADMQAGVARFDPLPRVVLLPGLGALCAGRDVRDATMARDITAQTLRVKQVVARMGVYEGLGQRELFLMEYRGLQHAKLVGPAMPLAGRTAIISGAAGAIGAGIAHELLGQGAHVAVTDLAGERLDGLARELGDAFPGHVIGVPMDVTSPESVAGAFRDVVLAWGGLDLVIVNAGIAKVASLATMDLEGFRRLERVNIEGTLLLLAEAARHLALQGTGGDIVVVSTKNVFSPGPRFGAYSATKAASHQLARIASLELAEIDVRVNMVSPDAVFSHGLWRSGLWAEVGPDRMKARGLDEAGLEDYYRTRNLLKARVTARHVANAVMYFATRQSPTTGATIPVDGGLPDATPR
jgi:rhamnose utilization protein RhaD (predicted bifunctional aldolase and dehydrogenase)/NAD(P)-dependent dehydrogenase (short-subunit alcohol dehydrogenase family)